jgi:hypothetical protein
MMVTGPVAPPGRRPELPDCPRRQPLPLTVRVNKTQLLSVLVGMSDIPHVTRGELPTTPMPRSACCTRVMSRPCTATSNGSALIGRALMTSSSRRWSTPWSGGRPSRPPGSSRSWATVPTRGFHLAYSPGFRGSIPRPSPSEPTAHSATPAEQQTPQARAEATATGPRPPFAASYQSGQPPAGRARHRITPRPSRKRVTHHRRAARCFLPGRCSPLTAARRRNGRVAILADNSRRRHRRGYPHKYSCRLPARSHGPAGRRDHCCTEPFHAPGAGRPCASTAAGPAASSPVSAVTACTLTRPDAGQLRRLVLL